VIVAVPEAGPTTVGVNVTLMVHDAAGGRLPLQLFVWLNGAVATMLVTCNGPVPEFRSVMVFAGLVVPITCGANDKLAGATDAAGAVPVPLSVMTCIEPRFPESSLTFSVPVTAPGAAGVNVTDTVQRYPPGRTAGQSLDSENPLLVEKLNPFRGRPPKLVTVMVWPGLVVPTLCENVKVAGEKVIADGIGVGRGTGVAPKT